MASKHTAPQRPATKSKRRGRPRKDGAEHTADEECGGCSRKGESKYGNVPWCGRIPCLDYIQIMQQLFPEIR